MKDSDADFRECSALLRNEITGKLCHPTHSAMDLFEITEYLANTARLQLRRVFDNNMIQIASNNQWASNFMQLEPEVFLHQYTILSDEAAM